MKKIGIRANTRAKFSLYDSGLANRFVNSTNGQDIDGYSISKGGICKDGGVVTEENARSKGRRWVQHNAKC